MQGLPVLLATLLALIHVSAGKLRFLDVIPRRRWLSFASGTSTAAVFGHLLPRLAEGQHILVESLPDWVIHRDMLIWIAALLGLVVFSGLERRARRQVTDGDDEDARSRPGPCVTWLHTFSDAIDNLLIGFLLVGRLEPEPVALPLFWAAMALHFLVNDFGLRSHHAARHARVGRWILAASVIPGSLLGLLMAVHEALVVLITALVGDGVIMNVLKEDLPEHRRRRFGAFAIGAASYLAVLLLH